MNRARTPLLAVLATATTLLGATTTLGAGEAHARYTTPPHASLYGDVLHVNTGRCAGTIRVVDRTDPRKRGWVETTYYPGQFTRSCSVRVWSNWGWMPQGTNWSKPLRVGPRGGQPLARKQFIGSGLLGLQHGTGGPQTPVVHYFVVP
ncbi:MAG: hypothetical protein QM809_00690 [Gordonia sp. (in: high G+C Gram-positive bacteria)]|uniref:hypothetical protein n=1 Tax=Gordonia sp. (in: high G+C Gram-positive bacteria) TaxID=84139 RepID=UPI0039E5AB1D